MPSSLAKARRSRTLRLVGTQAGSPSGELTRWVAASRTRQHALAELAVSARKIRAKQRTDHHCER